MNSINSYRNIEMQEFNKEPTIPKKMKWMDVVNDVKDVFSRAFSSLVQISKSFGRFIGTLSTHIIDFLLQFGWKIHDSINQCVNSVKIAKKQHIWNPIPGNSTFEVTKGEATPDRIIFESHQKGSEITTKTDKSIFTFGSNNTATLYCTFPDGTKISDTKKEIAQIFEKYDDENDRMVVLGNLLQGTGINVAIKTGNKYLVSTLSHLEISKTGVESSSGRTTKICKTTNDSVHFLILGAPSTKNQKLSIEKKEKPLYQHGKDIIGQIEKNGANEISFIMLNLGKQVPNYPIRTLDNN